MERSDIEFAISFSFLPGGILDFESEGYCSARRTPSFAAHHRGLGGRSPAQKGLQDRVKISYFDVKDNCVAQITLSFVAHHLRFPDASNSEYSERLSEST